MMSPLAPGEIVAGKYKVESVLGMGGVGIVLAARHIQLGDRVAIKVLRPEVLDNKEIVARFQTEARASSHLKSTYVTSVFDVGTLDSGLPYIVMEYLEGSNLDEVIQQRGALPIREVSELALEVCEGLAIAHSRGVIHRDLKPENIFIVRRDGMQHAKLIDFGVSKVALTGMAGPDVHVVKTVNLVGTPLYMSPEQVRGKVADHRVDIWALGLTIYELLTGRSAFEPTTLTEVCAAILEEHPPTIRSLRPECPEGLEAVVNRCLRKNPDERYQNVADLAFDLMPFAPSRARTRAERSSAVLAAAGMIAEHRSLSSLPPPSVLSQSGTISLVTGSNSVPQLTPQMAAQVVGAAEQPASKKPNVALIGGVAAVLLLLLAGGGAALFSRSSDKSAERPKAEPSSAVSARPTPTVAETAPVMQQAPASAAPATPTVTPTTTIAKAKPVFLGPAPVAPKPADPPAKDTKPAPKSKHAEPDLGY